MNTAEFFRQVLPSSGLYVIATPATVGFSHSVYDSQADMLAGAAQQTFAQRDVFFAMAAFHHASIINPASGKPGVRLQANVKALRCLFMDLDVKDGKFASKEDALAQLDAFVHRLSLPLPTVVDSGGGLHAYFTFDEDVPGVNWQPVADRFKAAVVEAGLLADTAIMADSARVLRVPGSYNLKQAVPREVKILRAGVPASFSHYHTMVGSPVLSPKLPALSGSAPAAIAPLFTDNNVGATSDPFNFGQAAYHCFQIGNQAGDRGATAGYETWRMMLGLAKHSTKPLQSMAVVSDGHRDYDAHKAEAKMISWNTGPATCASLDKALPGICSQCPHKGKITSPAQLGKQVISAAPPTIKTATEDGFVTTVLPNPPYPYVRTQKGAIVIQSETPDGAPRTISVSPYDIYPTQIIRQTGLDSEVNERSMWRVHLPRMPVHDIDVPQSMLADGGALASFLFSKGIYPKAEQIPRLKEYMSAYLRHLAESQERTKLFERCGWHENNALFVIGARSIDSTGAIRTHTMSRHVRNVTQGSLIEAGTLAGWQQGMQFYAGKGLEGPRFFNYLSFGATLLQMTSHRGAFVSAAGKTGRGKTTTLLAGASVWGNPRGVLVNGNRDGTTNNALWEKLGCLHSIPMFLDDTTERDSEEMRKFFLNVGQGKTKERMKGSEHSGRVAEWATMILNSTNVDYINRILSEVRDAEAHLRRAITVDFSEIDISPSNKIRADELIRTLEHNHGHAGILFIQFVMCNYAQIEKLIVQTINDLSGGEIGARSDERFWAAVVACGIVAAKIVKHLKLLDYPFEHDIKWMQNHVLVMRGNVNSNAVSAEDLLAEFLAGHVNATLTLSTNAAKMSSVMLAPTSGRLYIRHEMDSGTIFLAKAALNDWCAAKGANFNEMEDTLIKAGIITNANVKKRLGADTIYTTAQTRCWQINARLLEGKTL